MGKTVIPRALPEGSLLVVPARAAGGGSCRSVLASLLAGEPEQDGGQGNRKRGDGQALADRAPEHLPAEGRSR